DQFGYQMIVRGTDIFAYGVGNTGPAVYKLDTTSGDITLFSDANGGDAFFGAAMATSPSAVFIGSGGTNSVLEFDNAGNLLHTFAPPAGSGSDFLNGFGNTVTVSGDALVVGNSDAYINQVDF